MVHGHRFPELHLMFCFSLYLNLFWDYFFSSNMNTRFAFVTQGMNFEKQLQKAFSNLVYFWL